jgi:hypothetical protein
VGKEKAKYFSENAVSDCDPVSSVLSCAAESDGKGEKIFGRLSFRRGRRTAGIRRHTLDHVGSHVPSPFQGPSLALLSSLASRRLFNRSYKSF